MSSLTSLIPKPLPKDYTPINFESFVLTLTAISALAKECTKPEDLRKANNRVRIEIKKAWREWGYYADTTIKNILMLIHDSSNPIEVLNTTYGDLATNEEWMASMRQAVLSPTD